MKKLTSLQIFTLMSLALGSTSMYAEKPQVKRTKEAHIKHLNMQQQKDLQEAVSFELKAEEDELAKMDVLTDLAELDPATVERIIENEFDLEETFGSIRKFVERKNEEIDALHQEKTVDQREIARLAVELTDAQATFEKTLAKHRAKNKHNHRVEESLSKLLMQAQRKLKDLSRKGGMFMNDLSKSVARTTNNAVEFAKKSGSKKSKMKKSKTEVEEVVIQGNKQCWPFC